MLNDMHSVSHALLNEMVETLAIVSIIIYNPVKIRRRIIVDEH